MAQIDCTLYDLEIIYNIISNDNIGQLLTKYDILVVVLDNIELCKELLNLASESSFTIFRYLMEIVRNKPDNMKKLSLPDGQDNHSYLSEMINKLSVYYTQFTKDKIRYLMNLNINPIPETLGEFLLEVILEGDTEYALYLFNYHLNMKNRNNPLFDDDELADDMLFLAIRLDRIEIVEYMINHNDYVIFNTLSNRYDDLLKYPILNNNLYLVKLLHQKKLSIINEDHILLSLKVNNYDVFKYLFENLNNIVTENIYCEVAFNKNDDIVNFVFSDNEVLFDEPLPLLFLAVKSECINTINVLLNNGNYDLADLVAVKKYANKLPASPQLIHIIGLFDNWMVYDKIRKSVVNYR